MSEITKPKLRLDQRLTEEAQKHIKSLLDDFPELRSVAVVYDYDLQDSGSLPAGTWLPARKLHPIEYLAASQACDKVSFSLRHEYDRAQMDLHRQLNEKINDTKVVDAGSTQTPNTEENKSNEESQ